MSSISTKYGKMHIIDSDKVVSQSLTLYGEWADDELNLLAQIISPEMCVLDVGAFIGTHSLAFSKFVGNQGKVYSFEPRREIYAILVENLATNECNNVTALNMGLDEKKSILDLPSIDINELVNFGGLALDSDFCSPNSVTYQVDISTLDGLGIEQIDIIKLDVEGMERNVLNGAIDTITQCRPIIFCECNSLASGNEILAFCQARQYDTYGFLASAYNPNNFNAVKNNIFEDAKELALLLIPQEKAAQTLSKIANSPLLPINTIEDLVLPLLHKPQYSYEVLVNTATYSALGINFPSPILTDFQQIIEKQHEAIANLSQVISERDDQITTLQQWQAELHNEIQLFRSSTSWRMTKPLRDLSRWYQQIRQLIQLYQHHRWMYPGLDGFKRLISQCIDAIQKSGGNGLQNKSPLPLLRPYLEKELQLNPIIIFDHNGGGGSNSYSFELMKTIHAEGGAVLRIYCFDAVWFVQWSAGNKNEMLFFTDSIDDLFEVLLVSHSENIIINSVYGYPDIKVAAAHIVNLVQTLKATLDFKIHDFYALCSSPHLSDFEDKYCGVPENLEVCKGCLKKNLSWYHSWYPKENRPTDIAEWRKPFADLFDSATTVTFFDSSSVEIVRKGLYLDDSKSKITPHVINYLSCDKPIDITGALHLGMLGTLSLMKGGNVVNSLCNYIDEQGLDIPMTVVGSSFIDTPARVTIHGQYTHSDLPIIVSKYGINVILMLSIIPETFSYTISEAMAMMLPIITFDIGAQGHRVKQYALGQVIPLDSSPAVILAAIQSVLKMAQEKK